MGGALSKSPAQGPDGPVPARSSSRSDAWDLVLLLGPQAEEEKWGYPFSLDLVTPLPLPLLSCSALCSTEWVSSSSGGSPLD